MAPRMTVNKTIFKVSKIVQEINFVGQGKLFLILYGTLNTCTDAQIAIAIVTTMKNRISR